MQLLRAGCGWVTYLPASPEFISSPFDIPEVFSSGVLAGRIPDYTSTEQPVHSGEQIAPFVTFFSGHVAMMTVFANHALLNGRRQLGVLLWIFNVLQAVRLLATRGHCTCAYLTLGLHAECSKLTPCVWVDSIDLIMGWVVATYLTNAAEKLGNWYSYASVEEVQETVVETLASVRDPVRLFERVLRLRDIEMLSLDEDMDKSSERIQDPQAPARVAAALAAKKASEVALFAREKAEE